MPPSPDSTASTLPAAILLAACGGLLDSIVYLNHGHVFANAMTGNVVLLGIASVTGNWSQIIPHLCPILAFLAGVLASHLLKALPTHPSALTALTLEAVALAGLTLLPADFPHTPFVAIVAFVSTFQVATFRRVGAFTYNSTFTTGNLRDTVDGIYISFTATDPALRFAGRQKFRSLGLVCLGFFAGAFFGAVAAHRTPQYAFLFAEPLLLAVIALILLRHQQS